MEAWQGEPQCPDCGRAVRRLVPPQDLGPLRELMPEFFQCPECVVTVEQFGRVLDCPKLFFDDGDGELCLAPDLAQWAMANEWPDGTEQ